MRRYQFVQLQIYFRLMSLGVVNILGKLLCFSPWWLFHWQTRKSQDRVAITSWKNSPGFFVLLVLLRKYYVFLKMLGSIIPLDTDCGNAAERSKQIAIFGVCLRECNLRNIQKSRDRLRELTSEFLSRSVDKSCFTKKHLIERVMGEEKCISQK